MSDHQSVYDDATREWNAPELIETLVIPRNPDGSLVSDEVMLRATAELVRETGFHEDEDAWRAWVIYRLPDRAPEAGVVHESHRVHLKRSLVAEGIASAFS